MAISPGVSEVAVTVRFCVSPGPAPIPVRLTVWLPTLSRVTVKVWLPWLAAVKV